MKAGSRSPASSFLVFTCTPRSSADRWTIDAVGWVGHAPAMIWRLAALLLLVALPFGCSGKPRPSEITLAIHRALTRELAESSTPGISWGAGATRVLKIGIYDKQHQAWPVRAATVCTRYEFDSSYQVHTLTDTSTVVYLLKRNEFGEWIAQFEHYEWPDQ